MSPHDIAKRLLIATRVAGPNVGELVERLLQPFADIKPPSWCSRSEWLGAVGNTCVALSNDLLLFDAIDRETSLDQCAATLAIEANFEDYRFLLDQAERARTSVMAPVGRGFPPRSLPVFDSVPALAAWLNIDVAQLDWYAGLPPYRTRGGTGSLVHYRYEWRDRPGRLPRLIEGPKPRLRAIQRKILNELLNRVPSHPAAHGFVKSRSVITSASAHAAEETLIVADLADFFLSVSGGRVFGIFRTLGYEPSVATRLAGLCTTATPAVVLKDLPRTERPKFALAKLYRGTHLPQGAPTSPALANLASYRLDTRLAGLARRYRLNYTRYADDMAFSGATLGPGSRAAFLKAVEQIVTAQDFRLRPEKTRIMANSRRQRLLGMTLNRHLNLPRAEFDRLKAILHGCVVFGPDSQNHGAHADFRAHLWGRICWAAQINPSRAAKLTRLFERIRWPAV